MWKIPFLRGFFTVIPTHFQGIVKIKENDIYSEIQNLGKLFIGVVVVAGLITLYNLFYFQEGQWQAENSGEKFLTFTPDHFEFESTALGTSTEAVRFKVTNYSIHALEIGSIFVKNPNFTVVSTTCPKPPIALGRGGDCAVDVQFTPTEVGKFQSNLEIFYVHDSSTGSTEGFSPILRGKASPSLSANKSPKDGEAKTAGYY